MSVPDRKDAEPAGPAAESPPSTATPAPPAGPGVLTTLVCERCGNVNLIRVKGCWYCERCHYKFDCYGW
jgi:ribosomal protein L40E